MTRTLFIIPILALALSSCADGTPRQPSTAGQSPGQPSCQTTSSQLNAKGAAETNAARRASGLPPLTANSLLAQVAAGHACDMAKRGQMTHQGSQTSGPGQRVKAKGYAPRITAENIAAGPFDADRVLAEWQASKGHYANLMLPQVRDFGIGHAVGADGRTRYWAAVYAAPK